MPLIIKHTVQICTFSVKFMHDKDYLKNCNLSSLRSYARTIGVSGVTACNKNGLIEKIMATESGKTSPSSRRGRKPLNGVADGDSATREVMAARIANIFYDGLKLAKKEFDEYIKKELGALFGNSPTKNE